MLRVEEGLVWALRDAGSSSERDGKCRTLYSIANPHVSFHCTEVASGSKHVDRSIAGMSS